MGQEGWRNTALFRNVKEHIGREPTVDEMLLWLLGYSNGHKACEEEQLEVLVKYLPIVARALQSPQLEPLRID